VNERLRLLFESPSADVLNAPDNITVSPRGGLVLCEDGDGREYMHGLTTDGEIFRFILNNVDLRSTPVNGFDQDYSGSEFAGACYSPEGKWLFVNIQSPGISFGITGPWGRAGSNGAARRGFEVRDSRFGVRGSEDRSWVVRSLGAAEESSHRTDGRRRHRSRHRVRGNRKAGAVVGLTRP
jgi:secreted PhoX family phosphatase